MKKYNNYVCKQSQNLVPGNFLSNKWKYLEKSPKMIEYVHIFLCYLTTLHLPASPSTFYAILFFNSRSMQVLLNKNCKYINQNFFDLCSYMKTNLLKAQDITA